MDCPKAIFNINLPCGVGSNQNVGDFSALIFPVSIRKITRPPSMLFLANLSGCHAKIPSASPLSIRLSISLKIGLPGSLAVCDSRKVAAIKRFSRKANSFNSVSCASNDKTCLSSSSVDFLMYKKYFISFLGY
ncbi:MAG: hypothetical protein WC621_02270 [Patescibacteria group bacterium]